MKLMEFFATNMHLNNIYGMNKRKTLWRKDTRMPMCALMCVRVCACARRYVRVCVCAWVRGLLSRFFSRGCVRVGACVCACARVGGVGCKAAGPLERGRVGWFLHIHREHKGIGCLPHPKGDKLFTTTQGLFPFTTPQSCLPRPKDLYLSQGCLAYMGAVCFSLGYLFSWLPYWVLLGGWVLMGGVFFW
jgi:hypothetical protein